MKLLIIAAFFILSLGCSSPEKAPEIKPQPQPAVKNNLPESLPDVVKNVSAPQPETDVEGLPDITGNSVLDVNCAMGQDRRVISILERTDDKGWGVVYEKFGSKKTIAIARNDKSFCEEVVSRVKGKLQSAGFQCDGDISGAAPAVSGAQKASAPQEPDAGSIKDKASAMIDKAKQEGAELVDKTKNAAEAASDAVKEGAEKTTEKVKEATSSEQGE